MKYGVACKEEEEEAVHSESMLELEQRAMRNEERNDKHKTK